MQTKGMQNFRPWGYPDLLRSLRVCAQRCVQCEAVEPDLYVDLNCVDGVFCGNCLAASVETYSHEDLGTGD